MKQKAERRLFSHGSSTPSGVHRVISQPRGICLLLSAILSSYPLSLSAQNQIAPTSWPTASHDQSRTGLASGTGPSLPQLEWTVQSPGNPINGETTIGPDGTLYLPTSSNFQARNPDGTLKWTFLGADTAGTGLGSTVREDGVIYVGGFDSLAAIRPDGTELWHRLGTGNGGTNWSVPGISASGFVWATRADTDQLLKIDPLTGATLLSASVSIIQPVAPALGADGTLYVGGTTDGRLYAFNQDATLKWSFLTLGGSATIPRGPIVDPSSGRIYVANGNSIQAVNPNGTLAWTYTTSFSAQFSPSLALGPDGTIHASGNGFFPSRGSVYAIRPADGSLKWRFDNGTDAFSLNSLAGVVVDAAGTVYVGALNIPASQNRLLAIDNAGALKWTFNTPGNVSIRRPIVDGNGKVYIGDSSGNFFRIGPAGPPPNVLLAATSWPTASHDQARTGLASGTGPSLPQPEWTVQSPGNPINGETTVGPDGTLYLPTSSNFQARNPDGTLKWTFLGADNSSGIGLGSTVRGDGVVYVGGFDSLAAIRPDGTELWHRLGTGNGGTNWSVPVISASGFVWATRADTDQLLKIDPLTGVTFLSASVSIIQPVAPALGADGTLYVGGTTDGRLYAFNQDATLKWSFLTAGGSATIPRGPIVDPSTGRIYVANGNSIQAVNADGTLAWTYTTSFSAQFSPSLALGPDGTIHASGNGFFPSRGSVYAIRPADGTLKWRFDNGTDAFSLNSLAGVVVDAAGTVYVGALNIPASQNRLLAIDNAGALKWAFNTPGNISIRRPIIDGNGKVYIGDSSGNFFRIGPPPDVSLAATSWPTASHDQGRTGLASGTGPSLPQLEWTVQSPGNPINGETTIGPDGTLYLPTSSNFQARNPDGTLKWTFLGADTAGTGLGSTVRGDGVVYVGGLHSLAAIRPDGTELWHRVATGIGGTNWSVPVISASGFIWATRADTDQLLKIDPLTGETFLSASVSIIQPVAPALGADGTLYVGGTTDGRLYAFNQDATLKWSFLTAGGSATIPRGPIVDPSSGRIYVANGNSIQAVNPNGTLAWTYTTSFSEQFSPSLALGPDGTIHASGNGFFPSRGSVYAIRPADGTLKWRFDNNADAFSLNSLAGVVVDAAGTVYVGALNIPASQNRLLAIDNAGALKWAFNTPGNISIRRPIVDGNGKVYIGDSNGNFFRIGPASVATSADGLVSLISTVPGMTIDEVPSPTLDSVALQQGLIRITPIYDLTPSGLNFNPPAQFIFTYPVGTLTSTLAIYKFNGTEWVSSTVTDQVIDTVARTISGFTATSSFYALFIRETQAPSVILTPIDRSTVTSASPLITALYSDTGSGVDPASVQLLLDGVDVTSQAAVTASSATFTPTLSQGAHVVAVDVSDLAGNTTSVSSRFFIDSIAPTTALLINDLTTPSTNIVLISTDVIGFTAADSGSGVLHTLYALDAATETVFTAAFTLPAGHHNLFFRSVDLAGNTETAHAASLDVLAMDTAAPSIVLTPPDQSTATSATPQIVATYIDLGRGIDAATVRLFLDGSDISALAQVTTASATFTPLSQLSQGIHTVAAQVADLAGNSASASSAFFIDSQPPVTVLQVNGLPVSTTSLILVSTDSIGFVPNDDGTGVLETRYTLDGSADIVFTSTFSLSATTHTITFRSVDHAGNIESARTVSINVQLFDITPPTLALSPVNGSTLTTTTPTLVAVYSDLGRGIDPASVRLSLDGQDRTSEATVTASSANFTPGAALSQGTHTVTLSVSDFAGNAASATSAIFIDSLPPLTSLLVNGLATGSTNFVLASTDAVSFAASDSGVGVFETRYSMDDAIEVVFSGAFFLSPGSHVLTFHSSDHAGNLEATKSAAITITGPSSDTTPPLVRLDYPGTSGLGVEQAIGGIVNVRGAISDAGVLIWTLETAPGASATSGFMTIASGAGNLSGLLAAWNTTSLSGYQTLRLRAADSFGNAASATATVFLGAPVMSFAIGRKDSDAIVSTLKGPTGIAIRSDGAVWVASTENDKILLISPAGVLLGEAGQAPGHSGEAKEYGKKDKDHDEDQDAEGLSFKTPQGLALDAAGSLYVADRDLNRVVKLSPDGKILQLQLGKMDIQGRPKPGSGPGELKHPFDVAVDGNGDIYVADSGNHRIQVFNSSGAFLRQFGPGVLLSTSEVRGIALTAEGLWVSDKELERVFLFSRDGALIKSIGDADSAVGEISRTRGLAADRLGALYVIEPNRDRVQKFDPQGKGLLAFGNREGLSHADKLAKRWLTQPIDAAIAPDGSLWVTDTGRDRVVRYAVGVPAYAGSAVAAMSAEPARRVVDHKDGANVSRDDGSGVRVPKGALTTDLEITVEKGDENQDKEKKEAERRELKIKAVSEEVQYGPEGTTFNTPVTLTLPYDANLIATQGISEDSLKVYYWNPTLQEWQAMPSTVDKKAKTVNAQTSHFSAYQVGGLGGIGVAAIDDFGLRDGYAFPNPSRNGSPVTFRMQPGSADSIEVRIYDLSGRRVHSSTDFRFRGAIDDGNGKGAQNTYDHVWDVSGVGSGVYTFVITAKKAGEADVRKTGKAGVIK